jgi:hypothetical protein
MGDDAPGKQMCFYLAMGQSKALKMLQWQGKIHNHHCRTTRAF